MNRLPVGLAMALVAFAAAPAFAASKLGAELSARKLAVDSSSRVSSGLKEAIASRVATRGAVAIPRSSAAPRFDRADRVHVYVRARAPLGPLAAELTARGALVEHASEKLGLVQAWVPASRIDELAGLPGVIRVEAPSYATVRAGSVTTAGDGILRADALRALGFTGKDARVGVISDGANDRATAIATGDLPSSVTVLNECDPSVAGSNCNEGTAMLEIVHDLAPDAKLAFCSGITTVQFVNCVSDLASTFGANVIVDDLGFFTEPYFEDGTVAQAVADVVGAGVVYVSAAGNDALDHYEADFVGKAEHFQDSSGQPLQEQDFGASLGQASDTTLDLTIPSGGMETVVLQWNDPFGGSANDYDLALLNADENILLLSSQNRQNGDDDPLETMVIQNPLARPGTVKLSVVQVSGVSRRIEMFLTGDASSVQYDVADGSIVGHPAVAGALAVGAISASDPGNDDIEPFSSRGPSLISFPTSESRSKPDITAIDGVAVTGAGGFSTPFFGTSAAAPHAAGVAALLLGGLNTPAEVVQALRRSAHDLGASGPDSTYGAGRIDAFAAEASLNVPPNATIDSPAADVQLLVGNGLNFSGTCNDPEGLSGLAFDWTFGDSGVPPSAAADPGNVTFPKVGTFQVTFRCTDAFGAVDPSPATRTITVRQAAQHGGGGGCSVANGARADGVAMTSLAALLALRVFRLARRRSSVARQGAS